MQALSLHLPGDFCMRAARLAYACRARVLITTGFYLLSHRRPETDGPPGAIAVGRALHKLGAEITYISDHHTAPLLQIFGSDHARVIEFPITTPQRSEQIAAEMIQSTQPTLLIAIERCGLTASGQYLNYRGLDISAYNARVDALFQPEIPSIGIGDGGNEIGMGQLKGVIPTIPGLPANPAVTATTALITAAVSNWGAYGLVAGLSALAGLDLLPKPREEIDLLQAMFDCGCYDGTKLEPCCSVDGFDSSVNTEILDRLRLLLQTQTQRNDLYSSSL